MLKQRWVPLFAVVIVAVGAVFAAGRGTDARVRDTAHNSVRDKARYYYMEGARAKAEGRRDAAFENYRAAHRIDPTYPEAAYAYGSERLYVAYDSLQVHGTLLESLALMRPYIDLYPDDIDEQIAYGYAATQLDTTGEAIRVLDRTAKRRPDRTSTLIFLSDAYANAERMPEAIAALSEYERVEGSSPEIALRKITYHLYDTDTVAALREADKLIERNPREETFRIMKGNLYEIIEQRDSAYRMYLEAEKLNPESGAPKLALVNYYDQVGDTANFDRKMNELLYCGDVDLDRKLELVAQYLQSIFSDGHDVARGDKMYSVLREQYPHDARVLDLAARYSAAKGDFATAVEELSYAIDQDPKNKRYWGQLMTYTELAGDHDGALAVYDRAEKHIEIDDDLRLLRASVAQSNGKEDLALSIFSEMIAAIDTNLTIDRPVQLIDLRRDIKLAELNQLSRLYTDVGDVYQKKGDKEKAYMSYDSAIELDPANHNARNNYAYFMSVNGDDLEKAARLSAGSLEGEDTDNPTYLDTYAWISHLRGDNDMALATQLRAVEKMEENGYESAEIYDHLGEIYRAMGRPDDAKASWEKAIRATKDEEEQNKYADKILDAEGVDIEAEYLKKYGGKQN